jgi:type I restriction enzyme, S subunit
MSFPKYEAYKDSGVEWLGEVPGHWVVKKLGFIGEAIIGLTYSPDDVVDEGLLVLRSSNVQEGKISLHDNVFVNKLVNQKLIVREGDILICSRNGSRDLIGKNALIDKDSEGMTFGAFMTIYRSQMNKFLFCVFNSYIFSAQAGSFMTSTVNQLTTGNLNSFLVPVPPSDEQAKIAHFLDRETTRIDALIAEQQRLIELLKEKRQAVISHAVTKGIDRTVPMKDSGVEWLGEVPEHWTVGSLRWYASIQGGLAKGKDYAGRKTVTLPYLRVANVQNGFLDLTEVKEIEVLETDIERYSLRSGDVLMNEGGDNDKLGRGAVWAEQISPCLHQNHVFAIRTNDQLLPQWLATFTQSQQAQTYFYLNSKQSTNLASISASNVMNMDLPIPNVNEQQQIIEYLDRNKMQNDQLIQVAVSTVSLLQERRSALISAAVTGKIDVRNWQPSPKPTHGRQ